METDSDLNDTSSDGRSSSPAPSLYSFNSSIDGKLLLRHVYGRILNSQNDTYFLPADWEEHRRLDLQHDIHTINLGSLYPAVEQVRRALMPRENFTPAILDVGTGSGSWAIDMALEFPYCEVVGVDLAPPRIELDLPQNCRFEIDDANLGFSHYRNSFDVVHARAVCSGIRDFPSLLNELADVLRPGGVILLGDGDMQLYDETMRPVPYSEPGQPNFSYTHRIFFAAYNAMKNRGGSIDSASMSPTWLRAIDKFTDVGWHKVYIPMGPWIYVDERSRVVAEMLRQNVYSYISTLTPLLLSEGYLAEAVETMQNEAKAELRELKVHLYSRWSYAWAVKKP
ncbi:S-adenosyl-L-methionine-dependent methyltransferase [Abortiporus biennis]|nr:S-adenosyl-L-methionine-dependent methyltransferase [Abortiporus biennis]